MRNLQRTIVDGGTCSDSILPHRINILQDYARHLTQSRLRTTSPVTESLAAPVRVAAATAPPPFAASRSAAVPR